MKVRLKLSDADRERYGCDEWITADLNRMSVVEAITLQKGVDVGGVTVSYDSPNQWRAALGGREGPDGKRVADWAADLVLVWVALRQSGVKVPLSDVDYEIGSLQWEAEPDPASASEPGKDPSTPETTST